MKANRNLLISTIRKKIILASVNVLLFRAEPDRAVNLLQRALKVWTNDFDFISALQTVYNAKRDRASLDEIQRHVAFMLYPDNLAIKKGYATSLCVGSRYNEAVALFKECIDHWNQDQKFDYDLLNTYARLGICYAFLGDWDLAQEALQIAQKNNPLDLDYVYGWILLLHGTGRFDEINDYLDDQIEKHPKLYPLHFWKAHYLQYYCYDPDESLKWYQNAWDRLKLKFYKNWYLRFYYLGPMDANPQSVLMNYSEALVKCGFIRKAYWLTFLHKAINLDYDYDLTCFWAYIDILRGDTNKAISKCRAKLRSKILPVKATQYWGLLAFAQAELGEINESIRSANKALSIDPLNQLAWDILGKAQIQKGNWQDAIASYQNMTRMNLVDSESWENLARCYVEIGELGQAAEAYERTVLLDPYDAIAWIDLASIYLNLENFDKARSACERGMSFDRLDDKKLDEAKALMKSLL